MTLDQSNYMAMMRTVNLHATNDQIITDTVPAFADGIVVLQTLIGDINTASGERSLSIKGHKTHKNEIKALLAEAIFTITSPTIAYAASLDNDVMKEQMSTPVSAYEQSRDEDLGPNAQTLLNIILGIGAPLLPYGVTPAKVTNCQTLIDQFAPLVGTPRLAIVHKKTLGSELEDLFTDARTLFDETLDPIAISFKEENPHYYEDYLSAREIVDVGSHKTNIAGTVIAEGTEDALYNVKITVVETNHEVFTNIDGEFKLEGFPIGTYSLRAELPGWVTQTSDLFELKLGTTERIDFAMIPAS